MNGKLWLIIFCSFLFLSLIFLGFSYSQYYRKLLFHEVPPYDNNVVKNIGKKYSDYPNSYYLVSKSNPDNFLTVTLDEFKNYDKNQYNITFIPAHKYLEYTTGYIKGIEEIPNTDDFYLIIDQGTDGIEKYRYVSEDKVRENLDESRINIENIDLESRFINKNKRSMVTVLNFDINKIKKILKTGDGVMITPEYNQTGELLTDKNKITQIGNLVLRRAFGILELKIQSIL